MIPGFSATVPEPAMVVFPRRTHAGAANGERNELEIFVLGPDRRRVADLYASAEKEAKKRGGMIEPFQADSHSRVAATIAPEALSLPSPARLPPGDCVPSENARRLAGGSYTDDSPANLASTVLLLRYQGKTFLYAGDARGDKILEGLESAGMLDAQRRTHVDLMTIPHHGSDNNITVDFFRRVRASGYLFSGDGKFGNPEISAIAALIHARGCDFYRMYFVNRDGTEDKEAQKHGEELDAFFRAEQPYNPNYRRIFRSLEQGSVVVDLLNPLRN